MLHVLHVHRSSSHHSHHLPFFHQRVLTASRIFLYFFASFANGCKSADENTKDTANGNEHFSQSLNPLVEKALESITLDDGIMFGKDFEDFVADNPEHDDEYGDEYDEYDEDDDDEDESNAKGYDDEAFAETLNIARASSMERLFDSDGFFVSSPRMDE